MKRFLFASLALVVLFGVSFTGAVSAADFTVWTNTWVKVIVGELGYAAPSLPAGGKVTVTRERDSVMFLKFVSCNAALAACNMSVCTRNTTTNEYSLQTGIAANIVGGSALDFLTSLSFNYQEATGTTETFFAPLRVRGAVTAKTPVTLKTVALTPIGGSYTETLENQNTGEVGQVTFKGAGLIPAAKVATTVPVACQP